VRDCFSYPVIAWRTLAEWTHNYYNHRRNHRRGSRFRDWPLW